MGFKIKQFPPWRHIAASSWSALPLLLCSSWTRLFPGTDPQRPAAARWSRTRVCFGSPWLSAPPRRNSRRWRRTSRSARWSPLSGRARRWCAEGPGPRQPSCRVQRGWGEQGKNGAAARRCAPGAPHPFFFGNVVRNSVEKQSRGCGRIFSHTTL